jgi:hypothetical protein
MQIRLPAAALATLTLVLAACGGKPQPAPAPEPPQPEAAAPVAPTPAAMPRTPASAGAKVAITSPADGAVVKSPVTVVFAVEGMTLAAAGTNEPNTGHHHVLVDADLPPLDQPIPKDANHIHFGQAQMEGEIELAPGRHRLQLLLADGNHVPHDPPVLSEPITITVE